MKKTVLYLFLLIMFSSCATNVTNVSTPVETALLPREVQPDVPREVIAPSEREAISPPEHIPEDFLPEETVLVMPESLSGVEGISFKEKIIQRIKQNDSDIQKFFVVDNDRNIIVKADFIGQNEDGFDEAFQVVYDLRNVIPDGLGIFLVPFRLYSSDGDLVYYNTLRWVVQEDSSGILLAFDDDYFEGWESNFDLFDRYGARVTFFVQGNLTSFAFSALKRGHDVGFHSLNHLNLPTVSREVFLQETIYPLSSFRSAGIPLTSFAYPYGLSESWMHDELLRFFRVLRGYGVSFRLYSFETIRGGYISSIAIDNIIYKEDEDFKARIALMLMVAKFIGGDTVIPITSHNISDGNWAIKAQRLELLLQKANDLKLRFYLFRDFFD